MHHTIAGEIAQHARLDFEAGETAWASRGSLMAHSPDLHWTLRVPGGLGGAANAVGRGAHSSRKLRSSFFPSPVRIDSGWNWTP